VPLSDTARRLLLLKAPGPAAPQAAAPPPATTPPPPAGPPEPLSPRDAYRERARREQARYKLATDSEYWICLCFRDQSGPAAFAAALGLTPRNRRVSGRDLEAATAGIRADTSPAARRKRLLTARSTRGTDLTARLTARPVPDPVAGIPDTGDLVHDSAAELAALLTALTAPPDPHPPNVLDSPHWLVIYWPHRDAKDAYLQGSGLEALGDKFLDGDQAATLLGTGRHY
jgi:hypothetical protein